VRWAPLFVALALSVGGCAGHSARTKEARSALDAGRPERALELLNEELEVDGPEHLPDDMSGDAALLVLDRSMILQELGTTSRAAQPRELDLSSRDLEAADKAVEVLDLSRSAAADIGRYLFSDDVGPYKAPAYEKLMINTMNMVNYLLRGDLNGARVEARRLAVMQKFIGEHEGHGKSLSGPGSYLAGFVLEKSGNPQEALRYYDEALQYGRYPSLAEPVRRLAAQATYRSPRIRALLGEAEPEQAPAAPAEGGAPAPEPPTAPEPASPPAPSPPARLEDAEILVIVSFGRVPAKIARRIPIGLALTYVSGALSPHDHQRASYLAAQGLVTWVNYPELGKATGQYDTPGFALDGQWQRLEGATAIDEEARRAWEEAKGAVVASAITRMIARVATGEVVRRSTGGGVVGALLSLGTQATLTAADTPDTRSWSTLPARIAIGRVRLPSGTHWVDVEAGGRRKRQRVQIAPGGWAIAALTVLR